MNTPALRTAILAKKQLTETPYARAFNTGIDTAVEVVDGHAVAHAESISAGHERNRVAGKHVAGGIPYGYQLGADGQLLAHPGEQSTIDTVRRLRFVEQWSWRTIANHLLTQGIRSRTGRRFVPAQLRRMTLAEPMGTGAPVSTPPPVKPVSGERRTTKPPARRKRSRR